MDSIIYKHIMKKSYKEKRKIKRNPFKAKVRILTMEEAKEKYGYEPI